MKIKILMASLIVGLSVVSQAELFDRGGGMVYDDVLDITWLQDASQGGYLNWYDSLAWAGALEFGGFDDWRLPSMDVNADDTLVDCSIATEMTCRDNELGYMFYYNLLGSSGDDLRGDQGLFTNIQEDNWSSTEMASNSSGAWVLDFSYGGYHGSFKDSPEWAWGVRDGDVATDENGFIFPLQKQCTGAPCTAYTAVITAVIDHDDRDDFVLAFTGEEGRREYGYDSPTDSGYENANHEPFQLTNGHGSLRYTGIYYSPIAVCYDGMGDSANCEVGNHYINYDGHRGYDYDCKEGVDKIVAASGGQLTTNPNGPYNTITIQHANDLQTLYLHAKKGTEIPPGTVVAGQVIAKCGKEGTGGAHLHFGLRESGQNIDPYLRSGFWSSNTSIVSVSSSSLQKGSETTGQIPPVELHLFDLAGNHTGPDGQGGINLGIPLSSYEVVGDTITAVLPSGPGYVVQLDGMAPGNVDLSMANEKNGTLLNDVSFDSISVTAGLVAQSLADDKIDASTTLDIDLDGDGSVDSVLSPEPTPIADAANEQHVISGLMVVLDGSGSSDPQNGALDYQWIQTSGPTVLLSDPIAPISTFQTDSAIDYEVVTFRLTVTNQANQGDTDDVAVFISADADGDGVPRSLDNCEADFNPDQRDTDDDGFGNFCDPDLNNDCAVNFLDVAKFKEVFLGVDEDADMNGDSVVNFLDFVIMQSMFLSEPGPNVISNICNGLSSD